MKWMLMAMVLGTTACSSPEQRGPDLVAEKIGLLQSDKAFSDLSLQKGMKAAFLELLDSNGVLLRPNYMPIVGANAIDYLLQQNDTSFSINWQAQQAVVSKSADMGYTFGIYAVHPKYLDTVLYGTYVNIWKKDANGMWKIVLDASNEGIDSSNTTF